MYTDSLVSDTENHLKDVSHITQTADASADALMFQPDSEYYRVGILRSFNLKFESASPQLVIIQLFDGIYLKVNDPNECQTGIDRANIT